MTDVIEKAIKMLENVVAVEKEILALDEILDDPDRLLSVDLLKEAYGIANDI